MQSLRLRPIIIALLLVTGLLVIRIIPGWAQTGTDQEKTNQGAKLYAENCAVCHGPDGKGRIGATLAQNWPSIRPDLEIKTTIENGVSGSPMPAWGQANGGPLDENQIDALVSYILTWETGGPIFIPPTPTFIPRGELTPPPNVTGNPTEGAKLYDQNCLVCHGPNGQGRVGANLAKDWPSIRPDLDIKATIQRGVEGSVMPAWGQEHGGPLNDQQINNLVSFILTWSTSPYPAEATDAPLPTQPGLVSSANPQQVWVLLFIVVVVLAVGVTIGILGRKRS